MRIQHNISAINTARQLSGNDNAISKNLQRLSSGYRINSAADDAAGLAISEKMRSQINGLNQAENNAEDGISLVKTGEGNLNETTSILQRMYELANESSNGTYQNGTDRTNLNKELEALKTEIDRISTSTNFNKINLLDGSLTNEGATITDTSFFTVTNAGSDAVTGSKASFTVDLGTVTKGDDADGKAITIDGTKYTFDNTDALTDAGNTKYVKVKTAADTDAIATALKTAIGGSATVTANGSKLTVTLGSDKKIAEPTSSDFTVGDIDVGADDVGASAASFKLDFSGKTGKDLIGTTLNVNGKIYEFTAVNGKRKVDGNTAIEVTSGETSADIADKVYNAIKTDYGSSTTVAGTAVNVVAKDAGKPAKEVNVRQGNAAGLVFQIGADDSDDQRVSLKVADMSTTGLSINEISIGSQPDAQAAMAKIQTAINTVSSTRADFGALQNRLEHTVNNLSTSSENLTSAESRIRDVDMSSEMVEMTKNQILSQAATAMLAQANTQPQGVLQLLK